MKTELSDGLCTTLYFGTRNAQKNEKSIKWSWPEDGTTIENFAITPFTDWWEEWLNDGKICGY